MKKNLKNYLFLLIMLIGGISANAQIYPVTSNFVMTPPYPMNLATFSQADFTRMQLNIILTDNAHADYLVGLKLVIEGQAGARIETAQSDTWQNTVILNHGNNSIDVGILQELFNPATLSAAGNELTEGLAEGLYRFKVEIYDVERNVLISNPYAGVHVCWISRFEPPLVTVPMNDAVITSPVQNSNITAMFSWVPRGVYPGITDIEYTLEITEIYDESIPPEELFISSYDDNGVQLNPMIYSYTGNLTSKSVLFPTEFIGMQDNKWYAWRVKAEDLSGNIFYRNFGYSEVRKFYYGTPCDPPQNFTITAFNENSVQVAWTDYVASEEYQLQFRNKTMWGSWTNIPDTIISNMEIAGLEPGATYEFRLARVCANITSDYVYEEYTNPGLLDIDCQPPGDVIAKVDSSWLWTNKIRLDWEDVPGAMNYQIDVRCSARTLSKQTSNSEAAFRWGEKGIFGDTIWVRLGSQCWADSSYVFGDEIEIIMEGGAGGTKCTAPMLQIDSAVIYTTGVTEVYWPTSNNFESYTLLWRPAGMSANFQEVNTSYPPAIIQGVMEGDSVECKMIYHCSTGSDTSNITGFRIKKASADLVATTGSCYEPSYVRSFVPTLNSFHLVWEPEPNANAYEVNWKKKGEYVWNIQQVDGTETLIEGLEQDSTYLYRVRTACGQGLGFSRWTEVDSVRLDSLSPINANCPPPTYAEISISSAYEATITFEEDSIYSAFGAEYRIKNEIDWTQAISKPNSVYFMNLSPDTTYEVRTRGFCGMERSDYTPIDTFTTPEVIATDSLACGTGDSDFSSISNTTPIPALAPSDKISANGWELYIKEVTLANDVYNGTAYAKVPYLKHSMVEFVLEDVKINTDSAMFAGRAIMKGLNVQLIDPALVAKIENLINMAEQGLEEAQAVIDQLQEIVDMIPNLGNGQFGTDTTGMTGMTTADLFAAGIADLTEAKDTLLAGLKNIMVARDKAQSGIDILKLAIENALADMLLGEEIAYLDSCAIFLPEPMADKGFDKYRYMGSEPQYKTRRTLDDQEYMIPYKSLSAPSNIVKVELPTDVVSPTLQFTAEGGNVTYNLSTATTANGKAYLNLTLQPTVTKVLAYDSIYVAQQDTTRWMCVGQLNVSSYNVKNLNVVLVPVNGTNSIAGGEISTMLNELKDSLNTIYAPANVNWTVSMGSNLLVNDILDGMVDSDDKILTRFTSDMNLVIDAFEAGPDPAPDTYYMFIVKKVTEAEATEENPASTKEGYMPFGQRYGFLIVDDNTPKAEFIHTTAHELGHGAFKLRHPFSKHTRYRLDPGDTDNLMDYTEQSNLFKYQWDLIDDPQMMFTWFMSEEEAAEIEETMEFLIEDLSLTDFLPEQTNEYTYLTPSGKPVIISGYHEPSFKSDWPNEIVSELALVGFTINNIKYVALYTAKKGKPYYFKGYVDKEKYDNDNIRDYYEFKKPNLPDDLPIYVRVYKDGELKNFAMEYEYNKDDPDGPEYRGAGRIIDINSIKSIADWFYVMLPNEWNDQVKEPLSETFGVNPAWAIEGAMWVALSKKFPDYTFGIGYGADVSLIPKKSIVGLGAASGIGFAINNGELRVYGDFAQIKEFGKANKVTVGGLSFTLRRTIIKGGFEQFKGYCLGAGGCGTFFYILKGCGNILLGWPHEEVSFSDYIHNYDKYPDYSVRDLTLAGVSFDFGISTPSVSGGVTEKNGGGASLSESKTFVAPKIESQNLPDEVNDPIEELTGLELDLTMPKFEEIPYDNLNDFYLIQISAHQYDADETIFKEWYKDVQGDFYSFDDQCEDYMKYFFPLKFSTKEEAVEVIKLLKLDELQEHEKPFIVKFNKNLETITEKYFAYSNFENKSEEILTIDKTEHTFEEDILINTTVSVDFELTNNSNCMAINITDVLCENENTEFKYNNEINGNEKFTVKYIPDTPGKKEIIMTIITEVGKIEIKLICNNVIN